MAEGGKIFCSEEEAVRVRKTPVKLKTDRHDRHE
jgi:hypothetical protein